MTLRVEKNGDWFDLARYWDPDYADSGPEALSRFLGLPIDDVFPIVYDLTNYAEGKRTALVGAILKEPRERLSDDEIARLAVLK